MYWLSTLKNKIIFLVPTLLLFTLFIIIPIGIAVSYSFTNFIGIGKASPAGFANYRDLLADKAFLVSLKNTAVILAVSFVLLLPCSFLLAALLDSKVKGVDAFKALSFIPNIIAPIIVGLIWFLILDSQMGLMNSFLKGIGAGGMTQQWIGGKKLTPYSVAVIYCWQCLGFNGAIFLAGLKTIPTEIYESCSLDGASTSQRWAYITIPMLKNVFAINIVLIVTGAFKIFETVYQLTAGGPNHLSEVLVTYMYSITFIYSKYGYGMAVAVVTFILCVAFYLSYLLSNMKKLK